MTSTLVITGAGTGAGKTTVAAGLARALADRGMDVQPFKAGPDFIDADVLERAAGAACYTLDPWMMGEDEVRRTFARQAGESDVAIVEGVMGLFDGLGPTQKASTAHLARLLEAPVVPVIDVETMAGTAGAIALGLARRDPRLDVPGYLLNRAASEGHERSVRQAVEDATGRDVFGVLPIREALQREERHLGLVTMAEDEGSEVYLAQLADAVEAHVEIEALLEATQREPGAAKPEPPTASGTMRLGVASDACFSFYYRANLDRLERAGAEIVRFSPIHDDELPPVDGLYIGGGYPELHARALQANRPLREEIRKAATAGMPILAECGGLLYLLEALEDEEGRSYEMCGVLDAEAEWSDELTIGYVEGRTRTDTPLADAGTAIRGHEFHRTRLRDLPSDARLCYELERGRGIRGGQDGWRVANTLATYTHHHFAATEPSRFVEACRHDGSIGGL